MNVLVIGPSRVRPALRALTDAWARRGFTTIWECREGLPDVEDLAAAAERADALLVLGDPRRSPRSAVPGPIVRCRGGRAVPLGYLPAVESSSLEAFAERAARAHDASAEPASRSAAVLSQWLPRYLAVANRIVSLLRRTNVTAWEWTSDLVLREDMAEGLRAGLAAAIYVGHGRASGWVGYRGTRIHHLASDHGLPLGALMSLCCSTASRWRTGRSWAESVVLDGVARSALGAVFRTKHTDNTRWAVGLCDALPASRDVGDWVVRALPPDDALVAAYRLLGDPTAPLLDHPDAPRRAAAVPVYP